MKFALTSWLWTVQLSCWSREAIFWPVATEFMSSCMLSVFAIVPMRTTLWVCLKSPDKMRAYSSHWMQTIDYVSKSPIQGTCGQSCTHHTHSARAFSGHQFYVKLWCSIRWNQINWQFERGMRCPTTGQKSFSNSRRCYSQGRSPSFAYICEELFSEECFIYISRCIQQEQNPFRRRTDSRKVM